MISQEERFLRTLFPAPRMVGKFEVTPLTVGQYLLMRRLRCPFAILAPIEEVEFGPGDVAIALYVVTRDWREAMSVLNSGVTWRNKFRLWRYTPHSYDDTASLAVQLSAHIQDAFEPTPCVRVVKASKGAPPPGRTLGAPFWAFALYKMKTTGLTTEQALDVTVKETIWMDAVRSEVDGAARWASDAEEAVQAQVREQIKRMQETVEQAGKAENG